MIKLKRLVNIVCMFLLGTSFTFGLSSKEKFIQVHPNVYVSNAKVDVKGIIEYKGVKFKAMKDPKTGGTQQFGKSVRTCRFYITSDTDKRLIEKYINNGIIKKLPFVTDTKNLPEFLQNTFNIVKSLPESKEFFGWLSSDGFQYLPASSEFSAEMKALGIDQKDFNVIYSAIGNALKSGIPSAIAVQFALSSKDKLAKDMQRQLGELQERIKNLSSAPKR